MAARPPGGGGGTSEPEAIEFGIAALDAHIEEADVSFPATDEEIIRVLGDPDVPYDAKGRSMALSDALERAEGSRFENETELLDALYPVFDEARQQTGGFFQGLRDALPF